MDALRRGAPQCTQAVLVHAGPLRRHTREIEDFVLLGREGPHLEERHMLVEYALVARYPNVVVDDERQPCEVVRKARTNPASFGRVPPVLHVALDELS